MKCIVTPSHIGPAMKIAASALRDAFQTPPSSPSPSLLVHMFSNGGSSSLTNLYEQYAATAGPDDDKRLPSHVSIFDSSPTLFHIPHAVAFGSVGLSSPFQRLIAAPFLYAYAIFWAACMFLGVIHNSLEDWYKSHNNHPANSTELRRVYIYSPADTIVAYRDVESHAKEAKAKGFSVVLEKYEGSAHVAHVRKDESRYWQIVKKTWEG
ncbi:hypothetical protein DM02DRAFT_620225 [Periconia macrospinosa]|uniref:DUF829-domain-containing protein n=1 Tax=Periconia macrospinosa TaxID=97972 RepID=A0A2V1D1P9_9PLEO|nr:hypothetical protein DM02DRAFT_620225 [Periconia macrospinosa]